MRVRTVALGVLSAGVLLGGVAGALALTGGTADTAAAQETPKRDRARKDGDDLRNVLAARLGVTPEALATAIAEARAEVRGRHQSVRKQTKTGPARTQKAAQQPAPDRRAIFEALARLANLTPRELQAAAEQHGSVLAALGAHGVSRDAVLDELTKQMLVRFQPAIDAGRLTREQAEQLARQQARRLMQRLGAGAMPRPR